MKKHCYSIYISEDAKMILTERANALGLSLSSYIEMLARSPTNKERRKTK